MKKYSLRFFTTALILFLAVFLFGQALTPLQLAKRGYGQPVKSLRQQAPDTGMVLVSLPSPTLQGYPQAFWEYKSLVFSGSGGGGSSADFRLNTLFFDSIKQTLNVIVGDGSNNVTINTPYGQLFENYAELDTLSSYAPLSLLSNYATNADLSNYAPLSFLSNYATNADLSNYAPLSLLSTYVTNAALVDTAAAIRSDFPTGGGGVSDGVLSSAYISGGQINMITSELDTITADGIPIVVEERLNNDVYLEFQMGQSNMEGRGDTADASAAGIPLYGNQNEVFIFDLQTGDFEPVRKGQFANDINDGDETGIEFAKIKRHPEFRDYPLYVGKYAVTGTQVSRWLPGADLQVEFEKNVLIPAVNRLVAMGKNAVVTIEFLQGESQLNRDSAEHRADYQSIADHYEKLLGGCNFVFYLTKQPGTVNDAYRGLAKDNENMVVVETSDLPTSDGTHFTFSAQDSMAVRGYRKKIKMPRPSGVKGFLYHNNRINVDENEGFLFYDFENTLDVSNYLREYGSAVQVVDVNGEKYIEYAGSGTTPLGPKGPDVGRNSIVFDEAGTGRKEFVDISFKTNQSSEAVAGMWAYVRQDENGLDGIELITKQAGRFRIKIYKDDVLEVNEFFDDGTGNIVPGQNYYDRVVINEKEVTFLTGSSFEGMSPVFEYTIPDSLYNPTGMLMHQIRDGSRTDSIRISWNATGDKEQGSGVIEKKLKGLGSVFTSSTPDEITDNTTLTNSDISENSNYILRIGGGEFVDIESTGFTDGQVLRLFNAITNSNTAQVNGEFRFNGSTTTVNTYEIPPGETLELTYNESLTLWQSTIPSSSGSSPTGTANSATGFDASGEISDFPLRNEFAVVRQDQNTGFGFAKGTTGERPVSDPSGIQRWNTTLSCMEISNGTEWNCIDLAKGNRGTGILTPDASGDVTINHAMGVIPGVVLLTAQGTTPYFLSYHTVTTTELKVRVSDSTGLPVTTGNVTISWQTKLQ